jgi:hypothetical protein
VVLHHVVGPDQGQPAAAGWIGGDVQAEQWGAGQVDRGGAGGEQVADRVAAVGGPG